ncbi:hypothetical protein BT69DRAFT_1300219 [Atractiella rhizophila]|nr:hypothetical protein BT69DRAFT_1301925 [Atractiella rhizophila]KAH8919368.1 hypothetical protein BT69DRAFT_1300219 [Atractiella rhizophila]
MPSEAFRTVVIPISKSADSAEHRMHFDLSESDRDMVREICVMAFEKSLSFDRTNIALWSVEMCMVYLYYLRACSKDGPPMRTAVAILSVYAYTVTNWGNEEYLLRQVEGYFIQRYLRLSRNFIFTSLLAVLALFAFGSAGLVSVIVVMHNEYSERNRIELSAILAVVTHAVCDVAIATALTVHLLRFRSKRLHHETKKLLSTLSILAFESCTPTALIAICALITYLQNNPSNVSLAILFNIGRIYSITFLVNLLMRQSLVASSHTAAGPEFAVSNSNETTPSMFMRAILVQSETAVQVETGTGTFKRGRIG